MNSEETKCENEIHRNKWKKNNKLKQFDPYKSSN